MKEQIRIYGFIPPKVEEEHFVLGALGKSLPKDIVRIDGQWDDALPRFEFQRNEHVDSYNCTGYGNENAWEILAKLKYGIELDFSERDLGIRAGTYPPGNDPHIVAETARKEGLIPDTMLPFRVEITTANEYYAYDENEHECDIAASQFLKRYALGHEWVFKKAPPLEEQREKMIESLRYSPLGVGVYAWYFDGNKYVRPPNTDDTHWTVVHGYYDNGDWKCYDTYDGTVKRLDRDFGFTFVKRYSFDKLPEIKKKSFWQFILDIFKSIR